MDKQALLELLNEERLHALAERYETSAGNAEAPTIAGRLRAYASQLSAKRFVLPIAGIQGSGKSTLLNALAFDAPVLPIDAAETTSAPVEIVWSDEPNQATVHYLDGRVEAIPCTEEGLSSVVHNDRNPGNEKQVERVVLTSNREIFRHGLVLVDLPGVGSLTLQNKETTQRYLREAVGVIFMLRTVPPLTRSEAIFVSLQWSSLRTAVFVQNRWNDETDEEALAGREHNVKVLKQVATQARIALDADPKIRLVDGYEALNAAFNEDAKGYESSGARAFADELALFGVDWLNRVAMNVRSACATELKRVADGIKERIKDTQRTRDEHGAYMERNAQDFRKRLRALDARAEKMRSDADQFRCAVRERLRAWETEKRAELRNRMRTKMRAGIVDGPRLARALDDEQSEATNDIFDSIQEEALALQDRLRSDLAELDAWSADTPDLRFVVEREASTRYENLAERFGAVAGTLGGAWAGVEIGTAIGAIGGPIGMAIGAALGGIFGGLAGQYAGKKAREGVTYMRAEAVEKEVFAAIDKYIDGTSAALKRIGEDFCECLDAVLGAWRAAKTNEHEQDSQRVMSTLNKTSEEKAIYAAALREDLTTIESLEKRLNEVIA